MDGLELLEMAIKRSAGLTLRVAAEEGEWRCEGKFVRGREGKGMWLGVGAAERMRLAKMLKEEVAARVGFSVEGARLSFETRLLRINRHLWLDDRVAIEAVEYARPRQVESAEQRKSARVLVSDSADLRGVLHRLPRSYVENSKRRESLALWGKVWDISQGGISFVFPYERWLSEQFYARMPMCAGLEFQGRKMLMDCEVRYQRTMNGRTLRVGLAFEDGEAGEGLKDLLRQLRERQGLLGYRSAMR